jgi:hypothetical protein
MVVGPAPLQTASGVGPNFPSGTNTVEAAAVLGEQPEQQMGSRRAEEDSRGEIGSGYDPSDDTIDDVLAYVKKNPNEADRVLAAEKAGKNRSTLVSQLEAR